MPAPKYMYMLALLLASLLAYTGRKLGSVTFPESDHESRAGRAIFVVLIAYICFLTTTSLAHASGLQEMLKIASPFILYLIVRANVTRLLGLAIVAMALVVVFGNAALLPFDVGWTYWGSTHTFKGFYYFKTDLAFSIVTSLLLIGTYFKFRMHRVFVLALVVGGAQVVLSNARMNYLTFALLILFVVWTNRGDLRRVLGSAALAILVIAIAAALYDPTSFLSPLDTSDWGRFTQGRERIWEVLYAQASSNLSFIDVIFGRGMWFDWELINERAFGLRQTHNAHNEFIHLFLTQGIAGILWYVAVWYLLVRDVWHRADLVQRRIVLFAFFLFLLQGLTSVVSSYATKTWPMVFVLLMITAAQATSRLTAKTEQNQMDRETKDH